jgi:hypothetical protein
MNLKQLGAGLLSSGTALVTLSPNPATYWLGFAFLLAGPFLMSKK